MEVIVKLYSQKKDEIIKFLNKFYNKSINIKNNLEWETSFKNPVEASDIIGTFIDNNTDFDINMWVSLDKNFFLNITDNNADKIIRYLFERYPY